MAKASNLHGVDGCNGGWVVAESDANVGDVSFRFMPSVGPLFRRAGPERVIAIDIPIGLPKSEPRVCDTAARQYSADLAVVAYFRRPLVRRYKGILSRKLFA